MPSSVMSFGLPHWLPIPPEILIPSSWESARLSCTSYITQKQNTSVPVQSFLKTKTNTKVVIIFVHVEPQNTCNFVFDHNSGNSWAIFTVFVPVETGMNILQFTYLMAWQCHNCITLQSRNCNCSNVISSLRRPWLTASWPELQSKKVADISWLTVYSTILVTEVTIKTTNVQSSRHRTRPRLRGSRQDFGAQRPIPTPWRSVARSRAPHCSSTKTMMCATNLR